MLMTVDLDIPVAYLVLLLHLFLACDKFPLDGTSHMECLLAAFVVTFDAGALLCLTDAACQLESAIVQCTAELLQMLVISLEPDLIVPVHARVMDPFVALQIHHRSHEIVTQKTVRQNNFLAMLAEFFAEGK